MRQAFLERDKDGDGFLTVRELIDFFEAENEVVNCDDLRKLFEFKAVSGDGRRMSF